MNRHYALKYLAQDLRYIWVQKYQLLLDFLITHYILIVTSVVIESTG